MKGFVRSIDKNGTYGFIRAENLGEYFFHRTDFIGHWDDMIADYRDTGYGKIHVEFKIAESSKGPRAADVKRLDHPNEAA